VPRQLPESWLLAYLAYTHESKSPEIFHLWTGISIIAGALQRKVWFDMAYYKLYPHHYIVLVSPPGRCAKTTAMAIGRSMTKKVDYYPFAVESTSREKLIKSMSQSLKNGQSVLNVHAGEFASFFATSAEKMLVFLTDIYSAQETWAHETISGQLSEIRGPFLNLLAATTPDSLERDVAVAAVGVGLTSRIIFVYEDTPRTQPWRPKLSDSQRALGQLLMSDLAHIATLQGEFAITPEFDDAFQAWEDQHTVEFNTTDSPLLDDYFERKSDHLKKLCMVISAAYKDELVLTKHDLDLALTTLAQAEQRMSSVFSGVGKNPLIRDINDVLVDFLSSPAGFTRGEIALRFSHSLRLEEVDEVLTTLQVRGQIILRDGRYYAVGGNNGKL